MKKGVIIGIIIAAIGSIAYVSFSPDDRIEFNHDIRPILNDHCMVCHGGVKQEGGLSFLFREDALLPAKSGKTAIVPGKPGRSEVMKRIKHHDPEMRMPQDADPLTANEISRVEKWIQQGAQWEEHWAYRPVVTPNLPHCPPDVCHQPVDHFIVRKLDEVGLALSPPTVKSNLIRRIYLDLIGLPPDPETVDAFLADSSEDAFEKIIDELLDNPHYGERWASMWLDLARYADSKGYQKDLLRPDMWRYRDWVIHAFNVDMPFDEFTIHQLAGDLLQDATNDQLLATAFHRNTMSNDEGGTDDEEFRVTAVIDRVNTTMEVWQATTMACVQCHSHPYDPIRHNEYYELMAYFNNTADRDDEKDFPTHNLLSPAQKKARIQWRGSLEQMRQKGDTLSETYTQILENYLNSMPGSVPVMQELPPDSSRITTIFEKGNWLVHGDTVRPDVPEYIPELDTSFVPNRLGLANWLVHPDNPLTARVIVNRLWEQIFGRGLVATTEDFGTQGAPPTHPELLDYLAYSLVHNHDWHIKSFFKEILLSATYQQSARISTEAQELDPQNIYLPHAPRYRLSAEQIRDQALAVSGLLHPEVYGESVMPYQPEGVWNVIRHAARWQESEGKDKYRRGIYTFWRRVSPYPSMLTFDTPSRELCVSRRIRTNTPLQALVLLNDPVYVEAAEALAQRIQSKGGTIEDQINHGFQLVLMRTPNENEQSSLLNLYEQTIQLNEHENREEDTDIEFSNEHLGMIQVASALLNLDEFISRT